MKRILTILTLIFSIFGVMAQDYSVKVIDNDDFEEYKLESSFSTNIPRLKMQFSISVSEGSEFCSIIFSQSLTTEFIDGIEKKIIEGGDIQDDYISRKSSAVIYFSDGTFCKVECIYEMFNYELNKTFGFSDFEVFFDLDATYRGNITIIEKMHNTNIAGISMFGKRVNFENFSSIKAISAIGEKVEQNDFKVGYYECVACNATGLCLGCHGTGRDMYGPCLRCAGEGKCNDCKGNKVMYYYRDNNGNIKKR